MKEKNNLPRFQPKRILYFCLMDGLSFGCTVLVISGIYGFLSGTGVDNIGTTLKWAGIAFLIGCVVGLRKL